MRFGPFAFDPAERLLYRGAAEVPLPPRALGVLEQLVRQPRRLVSKQALMDAVWKDAVVTETSLIEAISVVRQALGDDPQQPTYIQTVHRRGYRFLAPPPDVRGDTPGADLASSLPQDARPPDGRVPASAHPPRTTKWTAATAAVVAVAALALLWQLRLRPPAGARPVTRTTIALLPHFSRDVGAYPIVAIAPDGAAVAYVDSSGPDTQLVLRTMDRFEAVRIAGTTGARAPFFSPDGKSIAFFSAGMLRTVPVNGGTVRVLAPAPEGHGGIWGADGWIVFSPDRESGLAAVRSDGTGLRTVTVPDPLSHEMSHRWPDRLGDPNTIIATVWRRDGTPSLAAFAMDTGRERHIAERVVFGRYAPTGHLVFARDGALFAAAFDRDHLVFRGPAVRILDAPYVHPTSGAAHFAFSHTGAYVYVPAGLADARMNLVMEWFGELGRVSS